MVCARVRLSDFHSCFDSSILPFPIVSPLIAAMENLFKLFSRRLFLAEYTHGSMRVLSSAHAFRYILS